MYIMSSRKKMVRSKSISRVRGKSKSRSSNKSVSDSNSDSNLNSGGVYCYMPYDSLDKKKKSMFKIDSSLNIKKSSDNSYFEILLQNERKVSKWRRTRNEK